MAPNEAQLGLPQVKTDPLLQNYSYKYTTPCATGFKGPVASPVHTMNDLFLPDLTQRMAQDQVWLAQRGKGQAKQLLSIPSHSFQNLNC